MKRIKIISQLLVFALFLCSDIAAQTDIPKTPVHKNVVHKKHKKVVHKTVLPPKYIPEAMSNNDSSIKFATEKHINDSITNVKKDTTLPKIIKDTIVKQLKAPVRKNNIQLKEAILPTALILYGVVALYNGPLNQLNYFARDEIYFDGNHKQIPIDNYTIAIPAVSVYVLNIAGIHGRNNFIDRSAIFGLANLVGNGGGFLIKNFSHVLRPDSSDKFSFPSGHAFNAFMGAEFLRQEYKDVSPWYGIAGYIIAAGTGYLRIYNDKHWLNDVVAGAGVGILSTRVAYWIYPTIKHWIFHSKKVSTIMMPTYDNGYYGICMVHYFN